jgi:hypothetical protein
MIDTNTTPELEDIFEEDMHESMARERIWNNRMTRRRNQ